MTYRLRVTARAVADADETHAWITEHGSADQADRWYQGLFKQMETLTKHPTRCPRAAESDTFPEELRQLLYGKGKNKHRIIFAICDADVVVLFIYHSARNELERCVQPSRCGSDIVVFTSLPYRRMLFRQSL